MATKHVLTFATFLASFANAVPYVDSEGSNFVVQGSGDRFDIIGIE
jgi:hypothetical protein